MMQERQEDNLKTKLKTLIDNIDRQYIYLNKVEFSKNPDIDELYLKKIKVNHKLEIGITSGIVKKKDKELPTITITYRHSEKLYTENENHILSMNIEYSLKIFLKKHEKMEEILNDEKVLDMYAEGTGLLTVYPYIRHMADILHREARIYIPPYPPMRVKQPK